MKHPIDSAPILIDKTENSALFTNKQITNRFLCGKCEQRLSKHGGNYVAKMLLSHTGFPLLEKLEKVEPSKSDNGRFWQGNVVKNKINVLAFKHMAIGLIWRGSTGNWQKPYDNIYGTLGSHYTETFRSFLIGQANFPQKVAISVYADIEVPSWTGLIKPLKTLKPDQNYKANSYQFVVPGMVFEVMVGGNTNKFIRETGNNQLNFFDIKFSKTDI